MQWGRFLCIVFTAVLHSVHRLPFALPVDGALQSSPGGVTGRLAPSALLEARYRLERLIGQGGFGAVYQARIHRSPTDGSLSKR